MQWKNPYSEQDYRDMVHATSLDFQGEKGMTLQAPAEDCDLNVIMKRFGVKDGAAIPHWESPQAIYGDFSNIPENPQEMMETLRQGEIAFKTLPAEMRNRFQTGAGLYTWLQDEKNGDEAVKLGLLSKMTPQQTIASQVARGVKDAMVSINTSSDKETLVKPAK